MRSLVSSLAAGLSLFVLGGMAQAEPGTRLGKFDGSQTATTVVGQQIVSLQKPMTVKFQLRRDRNRLLVEFKGDQGRLWRQSMVVQHDEILPNGDRKIDYDRPAATSRSGKYNLARLKAYAGGAFTLENMTGQGTMRVTPNGAVSWLNEGIGNVTAPGTKIVYEWIERFAGAK